MAAWLVGSFGNGSADELSDIDIVVVIVDSHADAVLEHAIQEIARFGETVWLREVPGNAPSGGAYASAGFKSTPLPIAVDWYWHRLRLALYPSDARLLFDKGGVRPSNPPASFAELMSRRDLRVGAGRPAPSDADRIGLFWAMVPVAAKYGARGRDEKAGVVLRGLDVRTLVLGGPMSEFRVHEYDLAEDFEGQALHAGAFELYLQDGARCRLAQLQDWGSGEVFDLSTRFVGVGRRKCRAPWRSGTWSSTPKRAT